MSLEKESVLISGKQDEQQIGLLCLDCLIRHCQVYFSEQVKNNTDIVQ